MSILILLILTSCSGEKARIELLENELRLNLPEKYETLENSTDGYIDFAIYILLKFDNNEMKTITKQIESSKYFEFSNIHVLSKFPDKETTVKQDSTINGIWKNAEKRCLLFEAFLVYRHLFKQTVLTSE
jgi:hypothetical protein